MYCIVAIQPFGCNTTINFISFHFKLHANTMPLYCLQDETRKYFTQISMILILKKNAVLSVTCVEFSSAACEHLEQTESSDGHQLSVIQSCL